MADNVYARSEPKEQDSKYAPHPDGQHIMLCVDAIDLGDRKSEWKGKVKIQSKVALVFASKQVNTEVGAPYTVTMEFTNSMWDKANLRAFLEMWRGKSYTEQQAEAGVPLHKLVGVAGIASVEHKESGAGRTYAKIKSIAPLMEGMSAPTVEGYTRAPYWEERKKEYAEEVAKYRAIEEQHQPKPKQGFEEMPEALENEEDDLPF